MKRTIVTYTTKAGHADENARLIAGVFDQLHARAPEGLRYMVLRYGEDHFVHVVEQDAGAPSLSDLDAFRAFQENASQRWLARPEVNEVTIVGSYGMLQDPT